MESLQERVLGSCEGTRCGFREEQDALTLVLVMFALIREYIQIHGYVYFQNLRVSSVTFSLLGLIKAKEMAFPGQPEQSVLGPDGFHFHGNKFTHGICFIL